mmetsp:Transcript_50764/g.127349  ORF Transcript_50764/g.127349 Transcript_50764/m.127349 type:complete len:371 (-) Transcript_50764:799-1911(-)
MSPFIWSTMILFLPSHFCRSMLAICVWLGSSPCSLPFNLISPTLSRPGGGFGTSLAFCSVSSVCLTCSASSLSACSAAFLVAFAAGPVGAAVCPGGGGWGGSGAAVAGVGGVVGAAAPVPSLLPAGIAAAGGVSGSFFSPSLFSAGFFSADGFPLSLDSFFSGSFSAVGDLSAPAGAAAPWPLSFSFSPAASLTSSGVRDVTCGSSGGSVWSLRPCGSVCLSSGASGAVFAAAGCAAGGCGGVPGAAPGAAVAGGTGVAGLPSSGFFSTSFAAGTGAGGSLGCSAGGGLIVIHSPPCCFSAGTGALAGGSCCPGWLAAGAGGCAAGEEGEACGGWPGGWFGGGCCGFGFALGSTGGLPASVGCGLGAGAA